ncbi:MAG: hypothetical protein IAI49_02750 [Candidatus Eremiobacteraeota bacterium]|nr:hypothetical protein [Candidatus Eremiobacteraeota bacterium]
MNAEQATERPTLLQLILGVLRPVEPLGDYFVQLGSSIAASAPLCTTCG